MIFEMDFGLGAAVHTGERKGKMMNKHSKTHDDQKGQPKPEAAALTHDAESRNDCAVLSDDNLEQVSAAGITTVPTMHPDMLLSRHDIPGDTGKRNP